MKVKHSNIKLCLIGSGAWGKNYLKTAYKIKRASEGSLYEVSVKLVSAGRYGATNNTFIYFI